MTVTVDASGAEPVPSASAILTTSTVVTSTVPLTPTVALSLTVATAAPPTDTATATPTPTAVPVANSIADVDSHPNANAIPVANTDGHPNCDVDFIANADAITIANAITLFVAGPDPFGNRACACIWPDRHTFAGGHGDLRTPLASTSQSGGDRIAHGQTSRHAHLNLDTHTGAHTGRICAGSQQPGEPARWTRDGV